MKSKLSKGERNYLYTIPVVSRHTIKNQLLRQGRRRYDTLHKHKKGEFHYIQQLPSPIKSNKISKTVNRDKSSSYDGDLHTISSYLDTKTILSRTVFSWETPLNKGDFLSHVYLTQCSTCSSTVINFTYHKSWHTIGSAGKGGWEKLLYI